MEHLFLNPEYNNRSYELAESLQDSQEAYMAETISKTEEGSNIIASKRLQVMRHHLNPLQSSVERSLCSADDKEESEGNSDVHMPRITIAAMEHPSTIAVDERVPRHVFVFAVYARPAFPSTVIRILPKPQFQSTVFPPQTSAPNNLALKWLLDKVKESQAKAKSHKGHEKIRQIVYGIGPSIYVDRTMVETLIKLKAEGETHVALCLAKSKDPKYPVTGVDDIHAVGVLAQIGSIDTSKPLGPEVELVTTCRIGLTGLMKGITAENPLMKVLIKPLHTESPVKETKVLQAMLLSIASKVSQLSKLHHPMIQPQLQLLNYKINQRDPSELADLCAALSTAGADRLQAILEELSIIERLKKVDVLLSIELEVCQLLERATPSNDAKKQLMPITPQRNEKTVEEFRERLKGLQLPPPAQKVIDEEISKLQSLDPSHHEYYTSKNYLNWLTSLPWGVSSADSLDVHKAQVVLEEDHYGMADVKQRILEFIAISALKGSLQGKILLLVGPPGVGKTSVGKSIARATSRKFFRFSVGGMNDVAEIKGHRRTYIGAMPGKFIQCMKQVKTSNPVVLIDEVDKISKNWDGDPASALLEALDPEQNATFLDNYLDVPFDLSKVLFICTANSVETIPRPLLDRMEVIQLGGYFLDEKLCIATRHLIPHLRKESGLNESQVIITDSALRQLIGSYCREAGVRSLQKYLEKVFRKVAYKVAKGDKLTQMITADNLDFYAGKPVFHNDRLYDTPIPGVVTGLAYNNAGGDLVWIESVIESKSFSDSKKRRFRITGKLGDVMKESTEIGYTFARNFLFQVDPSSTFFDSYIVHMHFPEGAVPKDGPSAGCAIVTSLLSLAMNIPVKKDLAMTGEISLTGRVLPVGGIKEKTMAAKRSNIHLLIFPEGNRRDVEELPEGLREGIEFHFATTFLDVFKIAFSTLYPQQTVVAMQ